MDPSTPAETEYELLHAKCVTALREQHKLEIKRIHIQKNLKSLRLQARTLERRASEHQDTITEKLSNYAKALCQGFCAKVRERFPRDIRDLIYIYFTGGGEVCIYDRSGVEENHATSYFDSDSGADLQPLWSSPEVGLCWNSSCVGADMVQEVDEQYYRSSTFHFSSEDLYLLSKFRRTDQWGIGLPTCVVRL
ncbi:hypothetical protein T440DRAFT_128689 [Plenodomus tracheiphilus IPT5]|uniref:Uncharacterized protein n=1 Tax=Plenodomus tracheiphilus IPT5 TaxID=1408161 RepID=A0A6A7B1Y8_9PLEO|nr:hypothetical protein T440DRAFT_128689 [Plenodomus tracheiphilus IPT5]